MPQTDLPHPSSLAHTNATNNSPSRFGSPSHPSPPPPRRRHISLSSSAAPDPIIGQVTLAGKFKCLSPSCSSDQLTFSRQADFKRHYENVHAGRVVEHFCPEEGCSRSRRPAGGKSKGRSFKGRMDKMKEHLRTVHEKGEKERKRSRGKMGGRVNEDEEGPPHT
ncbi:hypothetical protein EJ02DRAFT_455791 [Clathrospora elynae]|uniref:C2H2-type domain-containing protein n=1 Tax=Clathrospora elynae TaxID=706981 RepID=A0A6A5SM27_9PLEO|nr:hypothetical protein EJ02DRAFT_455791 [Clathrospora elynae]